MLEQSTDSGPLLQVRGLSVEYPAGGRKVPYRAVSDVDFNISAGETFALVGESGSGKTTIARAVQGLITPSSGRILFNGRELSTRRLAGRQTVAALVQTVFQDPYGSLNPARQIGSIVEETLLVQQPQLGRQERARRVVDALERVGLPPDAAERRPRDFSGGQRQRIAIARAVITRPPLVICDEAVSALDLSVQAQVLELLDELQSELGTSYLFITHDLAVVRHIATRVAVLDRGRVVDLFPGRNYDETSWTPYTRKLFDAAPVPDPDLQKAKRAAFEALTDAGAAQGR